MLDHRAQLRSTVGVAFMEGNTGEPEEKYQLQQLYSHNMHLKPKNDIIPKQIYLYIYADLSIYIWYERNVNWKLSLSYLKELFK